MFGYFEIISVSFVATYFLFQHNINLNYLNPGDNNKLFLIVNTVNYIERYYLKQQKKDQL